MVCDLSFPIRRWQQPSLLSLPSILSDNPTNRILGFPINGKLLFLLTVNSIHMTTFIWMFLYEYLQEGLGVLAKETSQVGDSSDPDIRMSKEKSILWLAFTYCLWKGPYLSQMLLPFFTDVILQLLWVPFWTKEQWSSSNTPGLYHYKWTDEASSFKPCNYSVLNFFSILAGHCSTT